MNRERDANFYMANLGSEFLRMLGARDRKDEAAFKDAALRCLKIIEAAEPLQKTGGGIAETVIIKGIIERVLDNGGDCLITKKEAEAYFSPFVLRELRKIAR